MRGIVVGLLGLLLSLLMTGHGEAQNACRNEATATYNRCVRVACGNRPGPCQQTCMRAFQIDDARCRAGGMPSPGPSCERQALNVYNQCTRTCVGWQRTPCINRCNQNYQAARTRCIKYPPSPFR